MGKLNHNPWGTAEWKEMRSATIGNRCEMCGTYEGPFTLQHHWHPPTYQQTVYEVSIELGLPEDDPRVKSLAYKTYQSNHERYMSGQDTQTFCRKCAYMWDIHGMKICRECNEKYHPIAYKTCQNCAKQERERRQYGGDLFDNI